MIVSSDNCIIKPIDGLDLPSCLYCYYQHIHVLLYNTQTINLLTSWKINVTYKDIEKLIFSQCKWRYYFFNNFYTKACNIIFSNVLRLYIWTNGTIKLINDNLFVPHLLQVSISKLNCLIKIELFELIYVNCEHIQPLLLQKLCQINYLVDILKP